MRFHFISGLPRSGSTLLAALLKQNPRFHADITSPVAGLYRALLAGMSTEHEVGMLVSDAQRQRLLHGLFGAYYADVALHAEVVFDTNRAWCARLPGLRRLLPDARVICVVRDVAWIVDSLERLAARNPYQPSAIFGYDSEGSVATRSNFVMEEQGLVGFALSATKQAFYSEDTERLLIVRYETLASDPLSALRRVYAFLDEQWFSHDFERVEFDSEAFDARVQTPGLHRVRRGVSREPRATLLPPEIFERLQKLNFWEDPANNPRSVEIV